MSVPNNFRSLFVWLGEFNEEYYHDVDNEIDDILDCFEDKSFVEFVNGMRAYVRRMVKVIFTKDIDKLSPSVFLVPSQ